jgi:hypothetical protein
LRHVAYERHRDGTVSSLRVHSDILPHLPAIFTILDKMAFAGASRSVGRRDETVLSLPAGCLGISRPNRRQIYAATLVPSRSKVRFGTDGDDLKTVRVRMTNTGAEPWRVYPGNEMTFCLSYHLRSERGEILTWDLPRKAFVSAFQNHVALLMPGDSLSVDLELLRPATPGRYRAQLDIVHEHVAWFSVEGVRMPEIVIIVS